MQRVIGVLSGKGGVGKTVTAINLSAALHEFGHEPTLVDADVSSANLTVHLGLPDASMSIQDVLKKKSSIYKSVRVVLRGMRIVPASLSLENSIVDMERFKDVIKDGLEGLVIVDAPPGFNKDIYHIMEGCDDILVVTNPDVPSVTDAIKILEISKNMGKKNLGVVLARVENNPAEILAQEIEALCEAPIIGTIPEDRNMKRAIFERTPIVFHSPISKAAVSYRILAANMMGIDYQPPRFLALRRLLSL